MHIARITRQGAACLMAILVLFMGLCLSPASVLAEEVSETAETEEAGQSDDQLLSAQASSSSVPVYRLYSSATGEHLYTTSVNEKDELFKKYEWGYEGVAWYAPTSGEPVYRLYQPGLKNHLYTTNVNEVKVLTAKYGWKKDNGGQPLFYSGGSEGIYRVYNKGLNGMHHLTTDKVEYNALPRSGWKQEGVQLKCVKKGNPITTQYCKLGIPEDGFYASGKNLTAYIFKSNGNGTYKCTEVTMAGSHYTTFTYRPGTSSYVNTRIDPNDKSRYEQWVNMSKVSAGSAVINGTTYVYQGKTYNKYKSYSYYIDLYK